MTNAKEDVMKKLANSTISKEVAVTLFGNEKQKKHFQDNGKFKSKSVENALKTTLKQYFSTVESTNTRPIKYKLGELNETELERIDNRKNNGRPELPSRKYLDVIVLLTLNNYRTDEVEMSMNQWVKHFEIFSEAFYILQSRRNSQQGRELIETLEDYGVMKASSKAEVQFYMEEMERTKNMLKSILFQLDKENLIHFYKVPKVKLKKPIKAINSKGEEYDNYVITIDSKTQREISEKRKELKNKYELTDFQLLHKNRNKLSKSAKKRKDSFDIEIENFYSELCYEDNYGRLHPMEVDFFWFNYVVTARASNSRIEKYIQKKRPEFYEDYIKNKNLFFSSSKNGFKESKEKEVLDKANKISKIRVKEIEEKYKETRDSEGLECSWGEINLSHDEHQKKINLIEYWDSTFPDRVEKMYPHMIGDMGKSQKLNNLDDKRGDKT